MSKEARLSRYIDALNRERAPAEHRLGSLDAEGVCAAARALKYLREGCDSPRPHFRRRLLARLGTPVATLERQAGLIRAGLVVGLVILLAAGASLVVAAGRPAKVDLQIARAQAAETAPETAGISGYTGTFSSHLFGEWKVYFAAPDKFLAHHPESGRVSGRSGDIAFSFSPPSSATITENAGPLTSIVPPGLVGASTSMAYYRAGVTMYSLVCFPDTEKTGRKVYTLGAPWPAGTASPGSPPPPAGAPRWLWWIDAETGLVLGQSEMDPGGNMIAESCFTVIDFAPPSDLSLFDPERWIPEGATVVHQKLGLLSDLIAEVGVA